VNVFSLREYSENNENYIEAPLIFDPVTKEDLNTDFKCIVFNQRTSQTQYATLKEGMYFVDAKRENGLGM
jgi:interleukin 1 receptor type 2